uniref:Uncharacterized protein n=1 Tax=Anguilla anguilla TaxID=7936 RepID=A0A0E9W736_ANGAN
MKGICSRIFHSEYCLSMVSIQSSTKRAIYFDAN